MRCQTREIGETEWAFSSWETFKYCKDSPIHDARIVSKKCLEKEAKQRPVNL